MRSFFKAFAVELRRSVFSLKFAVMALIVAAGYLVSSLEEIKFMWNYEKSDVLYFFELIHNIGTFTSISVLCCTVLNCTSFLRDYKSGYFRHCVIRSGTGNYTLAAFLSCVTAGGLILSLGQILYVLILAVKFPLVSENSGTLDSYMHVLDSNFMAPFLRDGNYMLFFAVYALLAFMFGALWASVGIAISAYIDDYYAASFSPYVIFYATNGFLRAVFRGNRMLSGFFRPDVIFHANYYLGGAAKSILGAALYFGIIITGMGIVFCIKSKRRCRE